jgi:hypothetical protein
VIFALVCSPPVLCDFCPRLFFVLDLIRFRQYLSESSQVLTNWYQESAILGQFFSPTLGFWAIHRPGMKFLVSVKNLVKEASDLAADLGCTSSLCVKSSRSDRDLFFFVNSSRFPGPHSFRCKIPGIWQASAEGVQSNR